MDPYCTSSEDAYAGSQLASPYKLTKLSGDEVTCSVVESRVSPDQEGASSACKSLSAAVLPKQSASPGRQSQVQSKKDRR